MRSIFLWRLLANSLALAGFCYQVYYISDIYFEYNTVNQVIVNQSDHIPPPKLVICTDKSGWYDEIKYSSEKKGNPPAILSRMIDPDAIISSFNYNTNQYERKVVSQYKHPVLNVTLHLKKSKYACYSIGIPKYLDIDTSCVDDLLSSKPYIELLMYYPFLRRNRNWYVFTISQDLTFYGNMWSYMSLNKKPLLPDRPTSSFDVFISYTYYSSKLLPYPHKTNCEDYTASGKESRAHLYHDCFENLYLKKYMAVLRLDNEFSNLDSLYSLNDEKGLFKNFNLSAYQKSMSEDVKLFDKRCRMASARPNCVENIYIPHATKNINQLNVDSVSYIAVSAPSTPQIVTQSRPLIEIIDYVTYILSSLSFWFAFSPLLLFTEGHIFNMFKEKCNLVEIGSRDDTQKEQLNSLRRRLEKQLPQYNYLYIEQEFTALRENNAQLVEHISLLHHEIVKLETKLNLII